MRRLLIAALFGSTALVPMAALAQSGNAAGQTGTQQRPGSTAQGGQTGTQAQRPGAPGTAGQGAQAQDQSAGGNAGQGQQMTAGSFRNQTIRREGQDFGRVSNVVRDNQNRVFVIVLRSADNRSVLVPAERIDRAGTQYNLTGYSEQQLNALPAWRDGMAGYTPVDGAQVLQLSAAEGTAVQQGQGGRIVVQPNSAGIQVTQPPPQVTVRQQPPQVSVRQAQPEIVVNQPAPTVTVNVPQPEILVRMPRPDVDVAQAAPQVEVQQAPPRVQVSPQRPDVRLQQQAEANVTVQPARPDIAIAEGAVQPRVRYQQEEARVIVNRPEGEPVIRYEQADRTPEQRAAYERRFGVNRDAAVAARTVDNRTVDGNRLGVSRTELGTEAIETTAPNAAAVGPATAAPPAAPVPTRTMAATQLSGRDVYNMQGENLGEIERVVVGTQGNPHVVISHGGFLGIGEDEVSFPMDRLWIRGDDRIIIQGVTPADIEAMDDFRIQRWNYRDADRNLQTNLRVMR